MGSIRLSVLYKAFKKYLVQVKCLLEVKALIEEDTLFEEDTLMDVKALEVKKYRVCSLALCAP